MVLENGFIDVDVITVMPFESIVTVSLNVWLSVSVSVTEWLDNIIFREWGLVYTYRQYHLFWYRVKMDSMQSYCAVYT